MNASIVPNLVKGGLYQTDQDKPVEKEAFTVYYTLLGVDYRYKLEGLDYWSSYDIVSKTFPQHQWSSWEKVSSGLVPDYAQGTLKNEAKNPTLIGDLLKAETRVAELEEFKTLISSGRMNCVDGSFSWTQKGIDECKNKDMFDRYNREV